MKTNKKTILISWFIGVGFGLFFSGIILSILLYTANKEELKSMENQEQVQKIDHDENKKSYTPGETNHIKTTETIEKVKKTEVAESIEDNHKTNNLNMETIELEIKSTATAREITQMLVDHDVISDYDEFIAYIISMDAERSLHHGKKVFPLNSDMETVFKILRPDK